jgi:heptosyltransferase-3
VNRILVIRGGAIGDFILTLPALKALRDAYPNARIEILGYKHIAALAEQRFYADAVRSIEYAALASFFGKQHQLDPELRNYFGVFDLIVSYLFDPDQVFETNLRGCGAQQIVRGPAKIAAGTHAAQQLARPIEKLGIRVTNLAARVFPSPEDRQFARDFLGDLPLPVIAVHVGSGSERKNWPLENWLQLCNELLDAKSSLVAISGEADEAQVARLEHEWKNQSVRFAKSLALPQLAAVLEHTIFIGHDSGISHLAAAAGAKCILLFGPTDPAVWAPQGDNVRVIRAPNGELNQLQVKTIRDLLPL